MLLGRGSAVLWARLAIAGSVLTALCAFLGFVHVPLLPVHERGFWAEVSAYRLRLLVYLCPFAVGLSLLVSAERRFKRGYRDDLWSEADLARVRSLIERRIWRSIGGFVLLLWIASLMWQHSLRGGGLWYVLLMPTQTAQRMLRLITPKVSRSSGLADWRNFQPIRSEHWGESGTQL